MDAFPYYLPVSAFEYLLNAANVSLIDIIPLPSTKTAETGGLYGDDDVLAGDQQPEITIHIGPVCILIGTLVMGVLISELLRYSLHVSLVLGLVEADPSTTPESEKSEKLAVAPPSREYTTRSFTSTLAHLRRVAGPFAPFRAVMPNVALSVARGGVQWAMMLVFRSLPAVPRAVAAAVVAHLVFARFAMVTTWIQMAVPADARLSTWHRSFVGKTLSAPWSAAQGTLPALAVYAAASTLTKDAPRLLWPYLPGGQDGTLFAFRGVLAAALYLVLWLPAWAGLVRAQTAAMPRNLETVVRIDPRLKEDGPWRVRAATAWRVARRVLWAAVVMALAVGILLAVVGLELQVFYGKGWADRLQRWGLRAAEQMPDERDEL